MLKASPHTQLLGSMKARKSAALQQGTIFKAIILKWVIHFMHHSRKDKQGEHQWFKQLLYCWRDAARAYTGWSSPSNLHQTNAMTWEGCDEQSGCTYMWIYLDSSKSEATSLLHFHLIQLTLQTVNEDYSPWKHVKPKYSCQLRNF